MSQAPSSDFAPNYDETTEEPTVLPAPFPNLLVNGSAGIAVGMATNVPPHNLREVIDGCIWVIEQTHLKQDAEPITRGEKLRNCASDAAAGPRNNGHPARKVVFGHRW